MTYTCAPRFEQGSSTTAYYDAYVYVSDVTSHQQRRCRRLRRSWEVMRREVDHETVPSSFSGRLP